MKTSRLIRTLALSLILLAALMWATKADSLTLMWDHNPESNIAGYVLSAGTITDYAMGTARYIDTEAPINELTVDGLVPGQAYSFAVHAYNTEGLHGPDSDTIIETVPFAPLPPVKPTGLAVRFTVRSTNQLQVQRTILEAIVPLDSVDPTQLLDAKAEIIATPFPPNP